MEAPQLLETAWSLLIVEHQLPSMVAAAQRSSLALVALAAKECLLELRAVAAQLLALALHPHLTRERPLLLEVVATRRLALALVVLAEEVLLELQAVAAQLLALALHPLPTEEKPLPLEVLAARRQALSSLLPLALEDHQRPLAQFDQLPILDLYFAVAMEGQPRLAAAKSRFSVVALPLEAEELQGALLY